MKMEAALDLYLAQMVGDGRSEFTTAQVARHVRLFAVWLADAGHDGDVRGIDHTHVARFLGSDRVRLTLKGGSRRPGSANAIRTSLRCFFAYLHASGATPTNAARLTRRAICGTPLPRALPDEDQARLRAALAGATSDVERRDRALVELMLGAGLRVGSAVRVRIEDLDLDHAELRLVHAKRNREQRVFLPAHVVDHLRVVVAGRTEGWLFPGLAGGPLTTRQAGRRLAGWSERAGLARPARPHSLRHGFACAVYQRCGDLNLVRVAMGHASLRSTEVYARLPDQRVRAAVAG